MEGWMSFREAQKYLHLSRTTLFRFVTAKKIPATKLGRQWRFSKDRLDRWMKDHENIKMK